MMAFRITSGPAARLKTTRMRRCPCAVASRRREARKLGTEKPVLESRLVAESSLVDGRLQHRLLVEPAGSHRLRFIDPRQNSLVGHASIEALAAFRTS
jgi:hypothetical protein